MYYLCMAFVVGAALGSFLDCHFDRSLHGDSNLHGRSHCDGCGRTLRWYQLIPVLSFLFSGGRCSSCKSKIPWRVFLSEVYAGLMASSVVLACYTADWLVAALFVLLVFDGIKDTLTGETTYTTMTILVVLSMIALFPNYVGITLWSGGVFIATLFLGSAMGHADIVYFASCLAILGLVSMTGVLFLSSAFALVAVGLNKHVLHRETPGIRLVPYIGLACMAMILLKPVIESW